MSENEIIELVKKNVENPTISTDTGLEAAQKIGKIAESEKVEWALAFGFAMYLYGSPRLTKDVDVIASNHLSLKADAPLICRSPHAVRANKSEKHTYFVRVSAKEVAVDWIVRNDGYAKYYRKALSEAVNLPNGIRLISPEWLVVLEMFAGRQKDYDDAVFLLGQKDLVNRSLVKHNMVNVAGEDAWLATMASFKRLCSLADGKTDEPSKYYDEE